MANFASRNKARKLANARNLAALANDTKWGEFFSAVERLELPLQVKLLYEDRAYDMAGFGFPRRITSTARMARSFSCSSNGSEPAPLKTCPALPALRGSTTL